MNSVPAQATGRFVLLEHDYPALHWDFLLEQSEAAATWRLHEYPWPGRLVPSERTADHRLRYLGYEGPVSGNRGTVRRIASGYYRGELSVRDGGSVILLNSRFASRAVLSVIDSSSMQWRLED